MAGCNLLFKKSKKEDPDVAIVTTYCFLHREMLCQKLKRCNSEIWKDVINMVNFIKQRLIYSSMFFLKLCENLDKECLYFLSHAENWGLSEAEFSIGCVSLKEIYRSTCKKIEG